eukprot:IDg17111t1
MCSAAVNVTVRPSGEEERLYVAHCRDSSRLSKARFCACVRHGGMGGQTEVLTRGSALGLRSLAAQLNLRLLIFKRSARGKTRGNSAYRVGCQLSAWRMACMIPRASTARGPVG